MGVKYLYGIDVTGQSTFSTNVGIGTLSPGALLHIQSSSPELLLYNTTTAGGTLNFVDQSWQSQIVGIQGNLLFKTGGTTERMRITNDGNVGIGTTSPAEDLHVIGDIRSDRFILTDTGGVGRLTLDIDANDDTVITTGTTTGTRSLLFLTEAAERMRIAASGNVGIGTIAPGFKLDVAGDGRFSNSGSSNTLTLSHSSGSGIALNISKGGNGEGLYVNKTSGSGNAVTVIGTLNATTLVKNGGTSTQYLMADGSVSTLTNPVTGTGTTNYLPKWTSGSAIGNSLVYDNGTSVIINATGTIGFGSVKLLVKQSTNSDYEGINVQSVANSDAVTIAHTGTIGRIATTYGSSGTGTFTNLAFATSGIDRLTIDTSGNVGIGTISPNTIFSVIKAETVNAFTDFAQFSDNTNGLRISNYFDVSGIRWDFRRGTTSIISISQGNNIGIGTTAPAYKLDVNGTGRFIHTAGVPSLNIRASDANFALMSIFGNQTGDVNWLLMSGYPAAGDFTIRQSDTVNALTLAKTSGAATFSSSVTAGASITIGSGGQYLPGSIYSDSNWGMIFRAKQASPSLANFMWANSADNELMRIASSGNLLIGTTADSGYKLDVNGSIKSQGILFEKSPYETRSIGLDSSGWYFYNNTDSRYDMLIDTSGNVGIGTTAPAAKLDVEGDVSIKNVNLSNQENLDVDTGTEVIAIAPIALYTAAFFDFVVKNGTNVRSGTVYACHDGTSVEYTETSTADLGNTSAVVFTVDISAGNMRLLATTTTDNWSIKTLTRTI